MKKRIRKYLAYSALGAAGLLALTAAGGAWWLWGWRVGSLHFHESWAPEQQERMLALDAEICHSIARKIELDDRSAAEWQEAMGEATSPTARSFGRAVRDALGLSAGGLARYRRIIETAAEWRPILASARAALKEAAASGKGTAEVPALHISLAQLACGYGQMGLVQDLVRHGAAPNAAYPTSVPEYPQTLFHTAISCTPLICSNAFWEARPTATAAERQALLGFLLQHGARINELQTDRHNPALHEGVLCAWALGQDGGAMLEWLLEHGLRVRTQDIALPAYLLGCNGTLPLFQRLMSKGLLPTGQQEDARLLHACLLRAAVRACDSEDPDTVEKVRWALEELHADPNAVPTLPGEENSSPLADDCASYLRFLTADKPHARQRLAILDLLLAHGAKLEHPERYIPIEETLRQEYMQVINKHNISLSTHET